MFYFLNLLTKKEKITVFVFYKKLYLMADSLWQNE